MLHLKASSDIKILSEYNGQKGMFLKTFAMNDKRNKNGWRVTWESIKNYISDFVTNNRPGILYTKCVDQKCDLDHTEASTFDQSIKVQEEFRVTDIIDYTLDEESHTGFFVHKVTDSDFGELVKTGEIMYVSPSLWPMPGGYDVLGQTENGLPILDVYKWKALHDAFVNNPAFGEDAKITALCEGHDCQIKLLTAKELTEDKRNDLRDSQFAYVDKDGDGHLPIHDEAHVRNAMSRFNQTDIPENQKAKVRAKICRAAKHFKVDSDFCDGVDVSASEDVSHLMQVPILLKHKGSMMFASLSAKAASEVDALFENMERPDAKTVLQILKNNSLNACECSGIRSMEQKDIQAKIDEAVSAASKTSDEELKKKDAKIKELESKIAKMEADADNDDDDDDNDDNKNDKNNKNGKKGSKAKSAKVDTRIISLEAKVAQPMIEKMVAARETQGMSKEDLESFTKSLSAKSLAEIESQFNSEKVFIESIKANSIEDKGVHLPFNGGGESALTAKSLEDTFQEAL